MSNINSDLTLYKLIILFMLEKIDFPMTNSQLSQFILDKGYTNYFNLQQAISEMVDSSLLHTQMIRNSTHYSITDSGKETLEFFENKISSSIKKDILEFLKENKYVLRNEIETTASFYPEKNDEYTVHCIIKEKSTELLNLQLNVVSREQAIMICDNWKENSQTVYATLIKTLLTKNQEL